MATYYGSPGPDIIVGTADADTVFEVGQGADVVTTLGGDDTVYLTLRPTLLGETSVVGMGSGDDTLVIDGRGLATGFSMSTPTLDLSNLGLDGVVSLGGVAPLIYSSVERFVVYGGSGDDVISGNGGQKVADGGAGLDTVVFGGNLSDYQVVSGNGSTHVTRAGGGVSGADDTLTNIEVLQFTDRTVDLVVSGALTVAAGAAVTILTAQTYRGKTQVYGELDIGSGGAIASSEQVALKASGAVFDVSGAGAGGATVAIQELSGVSGATIRLGGGALSLTQAVAATFAGSIVNGGIAGGTGGSLVVNGAAPLTLTGTDSYTGKTQIYGQLDLAGSAVLNQSKAVTLRSASAVFDISQATVKESILNFAGVEGSHVYLGANALKVNDTTAATFSGVISDGGAAGGAGGALIVKGTVPLTLAGNNTFTGGVTLQTGTLELVTPTAAGVGHALTFAGAATLQLDAGALDGSGASRTYGTPIAGFAAGDHIDLVGLDYASGATATYSGATLTVTSGGSSVALTLAGLAEGSSFSTANDGYGHVLVGSVGGG